MLEFYFVMKPRSLVTIPIFILAFINVFFHAVMLPLMELDLLVGNPFLFVLVGLTFFVVPLAMAPTIAFLPMAWLPSLWNKEGMWGIVKILVFIVGWIAATIASSLVQVFNFWVLSLFSNPWTTMWWANLWGFAE